MGKSGVGGMGRAERMREGRAAVAGVGRRRCEEWR